MPFLKLKLRQRLVVLPILSVGITILWQIFFGDNDILILIPQIIWPLFEILFIASVVFILLCALSLIPYFKGTKYLLKTALIHSLAIVSLRISSFPFGWGLLKPPKRRSRISLKVGTYLNMLRDLRF